MVKENQTLHLSIFALYTALAFIFSYIEALVPLPLPAPGMKLGLANLVLLIVLYKKGIPYCFGVALVRNVLTAITFGNLFMFAYSSVGSLLSLAIMGLLYIKCKRLSLPVISSIGGILHNMGQLAVAALVLQSTAIISYFPFLYFGGLIAGLLIGLLAKECLRRLPKKLAI